MCFPTDWLMIQFPNSTIVKPFWVNGTANPILCFSQQGIPCH